MAKQPFDLYALDPAAKRAMEAEDRFKADLKTKNKFRARPRTGATASAPRRGGVERTADRLAAFGVPLSITEAIKDVDRNLLGFDEAAQSLHNIIGGDGSAGDYVNAALSLPVIGGLAAKPVEMLAAKAGRGLARAGERALASRAGRYLTEARPLIDNADDAIETAFTVTPGAQRRITNQRPVVQGLPAPEQRLGLPAPGEGVTLVPASPITPQSRNPLMGLHNINERKLGMANRLGGLPVPSIAVANPELGFEGFGNISLVAPQKLVTPASGNPVFAADVYSARFPALNDEETKIFRGYTDNGRRYSPLNMANVVREMKGNPRNAEGSNYGAGSVRAVVTPQFRSLREMQDARENIISGSDFQPIKDEANDRLYALGERFLPYSKYSRPSVLDFPEQLAEAARVGFHDLDYNYEGLPPELIEEARGYLDYLRDMPTEYFEAKPQRGVKLNEFAAAIVPKDTSDETIQLLQNQGVTNIQRYDADRLRGLPTRKEALDMFRVHRFAVGGRI